MLQCNAKHVATLAAVFAGSLVGTSLTAHADGAQSSGNAAEPSAAVGPPIALSREGETSANEPTFQTETRAKVWPNRPLLATGATVFGLSYLPAVVGGAVSDADHRKDLYIPVAGPWMMLARGEDESGGEKTLLIVDGVAQGLGALMLFASTFIPERKTRHWYLIGSNTLIAPTRVATGYGMGATGRF
jgi:hypothetical protein